MGVYIYKTTPKAVKMVKVRNTDTGEVSMKPVQVYQFMDKCSGQWEIQERQEKRTAKLEKNFDDVGSEPLELGIVKYSGGFDSTLFFTKGAVCPIEPMDRPQSEMPRYTVEV